MTFTWFLLVVMVVMREATGQSGIKTWVQDIRPGYKIDLAHYREAQLDHISEFARVVPVISLVVAFGWGGCGDILAVEPEQ